MILAGTGHRPPKLGGYRIPNFVYDQAIIGIRNALESLRPTLVLSGMALGFDQWLAEACLELSIPFDACIPFHGYESRWPEESKRVFELLCANAHEVHYVADTHVYSGAHMHRRNRWMVDHASHVLTLFNGRDEPGSGTASCLNYARSRNKPIYQIILAPEVWEEARRVEEMLERRRQARLNPAPMTQFRQAEAYPSPATVPPEILPQQTPPALSEEEAARLLGAQMAQAYTEAIRQQFSPQVPQETADAILRDIFYEQQRQQARTVNFGTLYGVDEGVLGGDRTVIQVREIETKKEVQDEKERFQPGRLIDLDD